MSEGSSNPGSGQNKNEDIGKWISPSKAVIQEFLVDVLGGLVPGIILIVGVVISIVPALIDLQSTLAPDHAKNFLDQIGHFLRAVSGMSGTLMFFCCVGVALVTYVLGHIYYRKDPKEPDRASYRLLAREIIFNTISQSLAEEGSKTLRIWTRIQLGWWRTLAKILRLREPQRFLPKPWLLHLKDLTQKFSEDLGAPNEGACEFPYPNFKDYLHTRRFTYLEKMVPWDCHTRSKVYINVLKMRLIQSFPERCRPLVHNEAHVRLASGTWYVAGALKSISLFGLALVALSIFLSGRASGQWLSEEMIGTHFWMLILSSSTFYICWILKHRIEAFFHYQRMREVVFVLETGYYAFRFTPHLLNPPFEISEQIPSLPSPQAAPSRSTAAGG